jgi:hypothetical protein
MTSKNLRASTKKFPTLHLEPHNELRSGWGAECGQGRTYICSMRTNGNSSLDRPGRPSWVSNDSIDQSIRAPGLAFGCTGDKLHHICGPISSLVVDYHRLLWSIEQVAGDTCENSALFIYHNYVSLLQQVIDLLQPLTEFSIAAVSRETLLAGWCDIIKFR